MELSIAILFTTVLVATTVGLALFVTDLYRVEKGIEK